MWKRLSFLLGIVVVSSVFVPFAFAKKYMGYGGALCQSSDYYECINVQPGDTWDKLFPDPATREFAMRLNRLNIRLYPGMQIAMPKNGNTNIMDYAPFPQRINGIGRTKVVVDPKYLAWGAYDAEGNLVNWGPASAGGNYCADIGKKCNTKTGKFTIYHKRGAECKSSIYPIEKPGAPMPHCMFFHGGMALHGSYMLPGFNDSHGCVRLFPSDAKWLNRDFIDVGGTAVEVLPYTSQT